MSDDLEARAPTIARQWERLYWDTTMRLRKVVDGLGNVERIEQLYRNRFNGDEEWRAIERVKDEK